MNELQTMWSISRRKSLINCPREYVLKYSNNQSAYREIKRIRKKNPWKIYLLALSEKL